MVLVDSVRVLSLQQFRFARSKCRRIRDKFRKDQRNWRYMDVRGVKVFPDGRVVLPEVPVGKHIIQYWLEQTYDAGDETRCAKVVELVDAL